MVLFRNVAVVGLGLIGGSLAGDIRGLGLADNLIGISRRQETIRAAKRRGFVDRASGDIRAVRGCDLVILCAPVKAIIGLLADIAPYLSRGAIVTDVGSTKVEIVRRAKQALPAGVSFVGGHPLAGSEKAGIGQASRGLFGNSCCILTPGKGINKVKALWRTLGSRVKVWQPEEHDRIVSFISQLPHLAAFGLVCAIPEKFLPYGSGGLKDATRIAASSPYLWRDIFLSNKNFALQALKAFRKQLGELEGLIRGGDEQGLFKKIEKASRLRRAFS